MRVQAAVKRKASRMPFAAALRPARPAAGVNFAVLLHISVAVSTHDLPSCSALRPPPARRLAVGRPFALLQSHKPGERHQRLPASWLTPRPRLQPRRRAVLGAATRLRRCEIAAQSPTCSRPYCLPAVPCWRSPAARANTARTSRSVFPRSPGSRVIRSPLLGPRSLSGAMALAIHVQPST
jgi:hypothetical protein